MGSHISVLLPETLEYLAVKKGGTYVDLTLGRAGTSSAILSLIGPEGHLYSFDVDSEAIEESRAKLSLISPNFEIIDSNFRFLKRELNARGIEKVDGITMDLGVSSPQFDEAERGFSYRLDAPLDMRMDLTKDLTAAKIVNSYSEKELARIFYLYGEDPDSRSVAHKIILTRESHPIETTEELVEIIKSAKPRRSLEKKGHPAKQIFQALRIEVNDELGALSDALHDIPLLLAPNGRAVVISFQSLEDRLVKDAFRSLSVLEGNRDNFCLPPEDLPIADFVLLTKKPVIAGEEELTNNHRAKSAKLRAIQRKEATNK